MIAHALWRTLAAAPTLLAAVTLSFFLVRFAPGGPFDLERPLDPLVMARLNALYGLDQPLLEQFRLYLVGLAHGDLGPSFYWRDFSVADFFQHALPISMRLGACALALAIVAGGALGLLAAVCRGSLADRLAMAGATLGLALPTFVTAPLLQLSLGLGLRLTPVGGWEDGAPANMALPVVTLALPLAAVIARLLRAAMIEALNAPHMLTLRANGLPARVILTHALRAAALPVVSYLGPAAAGLLTGSIVVETIFGIPGIGRTFVEGALNRDYPLVLGGVLIVAVLVIGANLLVDLIHALLDPRLAHA